MTVCIASAGQSTMPYNPDANDDGYIGSPDLLSFLPLFGTQVGIDSSLTCDYDGTPIEEFFGNVWNGDIIIDSILVQYHTIDSALVYIAGCPDPYWDVVSYERAWTTSSIYGNVTWQAWNSLSNAGNKQFRIDYSTQYGYFRFTISDDEVYNLGLGDVLGNTNAKAMRSIDSENWYIPFPTESASFNGNGIHFENYNGFLSGATYVNILPYWHYAE